MPINTRTFSDIDFNFIPNPVTGDIALRLDDYAVKAAVQNLILTSFYERPFHSEIGSPIKRLLFEPASPMVGAMIKQAIANTIANYEPRVNLTDIIVNLSDDGYSVYVTLEYTILNTNQPQSLDLTLQRSR
jgi:phage baseplate assembly protein W